jgi:hypothetical protein
LAQLFLPGCRFDHHASHFRKDLFLAKDQIFLVIDLDVVARILAEQDVVTGLHVKGNAPSLRVELVGTDGDHFAFLGLLFGCIGMMIPPFAASFSANLRTNVRSCRGITFAVIFITSVCSVPKLKDLRRH